MILRVQRRLPVVVSLVAGAALAGCTYPGNTVDGQPAATAAPSRDALDTSFTFYARIGHKAASVGDYETAIGFYRRAIARDYGTTEAHVGIGQAYAATGFPQEAASSFRTALRQDPDNKAATLGLATAEIALGRADHAAMLLSRGQKTATDPAYFNQLGIALDLMGHYDEAEAAYRRGLEFDPNHPGLKNNLAMSLALAGEYRSSKSMLRSLSSASRDASLIENKDLVTRAESTGSPNEANADIRQGAQLVMAFHTGIAQREELTYHKFDERAWRSPKFPEMAFGEASLPEEATVGAIPEEPPESFSPQTEYDIPYAVGSSPEPTGKAPEPVSAALAQDSELVSAQLKPAIDDHSTKVASSAAPKVPAAARSGAFQVQLGSFRSRDRAHSYWATVSLHAPKLLEPMSASVERADLGPAKGTYFRLRTKPLHGRVAADRLCSGLKAKSIDCLVVTYRPEAAPPPEAEPVAGMTPDARKGT